MARAGGQAVPGIQPLAGFAVFPGLDVSGDQHAFGAERRGVQSAEDAPLAAVAEHIQGEHMLPDPGGGQDNLLRLLFREDAFADALGDLRFESPLQSGGCLGPVSPDRRLADDRQPVAFGNFAKRNGLP